MVHTALWTTVLVGLLLNWSLGVPGAAAQTVLRLAHDNPATSPWQAGALRFADLVNKKSAGSLQIKVYPAAQLGDLRELAELTKAGTVDLTFLTAGVAANFVSSMDLFSLPFLFNDLEQGRALYNGPLGKRLLQDAEPAGFVGLAFNILSFRSPMVAKKPITAPEDFRGLKMRLMQVPTHMETYKTLGASPVAIPYSEVYSSAQSGVVDGAEGAPINVYVTRWHEVMKHYSLLPVFFNAGVLYMGKKTAARLSPEHRAIIESSLPEVCELINSEYIRRDAEAIKNMESQGVRIEKGPFDLRRYREIVKPIYDARVPKLPPAARDIVAELQREWQSR